MTTVDEFINKGGLFIVDKREGKFCIKAQKWADYEYRVVKVKVLQETISPAALEYAVFEWYVYASTVAHREATLDRSYEDIMTRF